MTATERKHDEPSLELYRPALPSRRLATLVGSIAARASDWAWWPVYERWKRGEEVSTFHRKWLAITTKNLQLQARERRLSMKGIRNIKPWPQRSST